MTHIHTSSTQHALSRVALSPATAARVRPSHARGGGGGGASDALRPLGYDKCACFIRQMCVCHVHEGVTSRSWRRHFTYIEDPCQMTWLMICNELHDSWRAMNYMMSYALRPQCQMTRLMSCMTWQMLCTVPVVPNDMTRHVQCHLWHAMSYQMTWLMTCNALRPLMSRMTWGMAYHMT